MRALPECRAVMAAGGFIIEMHHAALASIDTQTVGGRNIVNNIGLSRNEGLTFQIQDSQRKTSGHRVLQKPRSGCPAEVNRT